MCAFALLCLSVRASTSLHLDMEQFSFANRAGILEFSFDLFLLILLSWNFALASAPAAAELPSLRPPATGGGRGASETEPESGSSHSPS